MWSSFTNTNFNKIEISKFNKQFIKKIKFIRSEIIKMEDVNYTYSITKISNNIIDKLKSSPWVSQELTYDYLPYEINIKWNNNNIYIKTSENKFNNIINRLHIFLKIINYINKINDNIEMYLILSNLKKNINEYEVISPKHINSGYTDTSKKIIFIWREEEFEKVCFHEIIHLLDQDHRHEHVNIETNISGPTSYYEAITDFKAIIFNIIYLSLITKIKLKILYSFEYSFIKNQSNYIYYILKIKNEQKSPAYSYFVLKYFIFKYFNGQYFNENLFDDIFYKNINYYKLIDQIKNYDIINIKYTNLNSARMTFFELC
jgi:hypothetical protein